MQLLARTRALLARHPSIYWLVVGALAAAVATTVAAHVREVDAARRAWDEPRRVWVAPHDLRPGEPVTAVAREWPAAMVPAGAVDAVPAGATAMQHVGAGEIVTAADVGRGVYASMPAGWQGVAFAPDDTTIRVAVGDRVAVVADGTVVVEEGVVIDVGERSVTVAVPADDAPLAALSSRLQTAALVLVRPRG